MAMSLMHYGDKYITGSGGRATKATQAVALVVTY